MDKFSWRRYVEVLSKKFTRMSDFAEHLEANAFDVGLCVGKNRKYVMDNHYDWIFDRDFTFDELDYIFQNDKKDIETKCDFVDDNGISLYNAPILSTPDEIVSKIDKLNEYLFYSIFVAEDDNTTWGQIAEYMEDKDGIDLLKSTRFDRSELIPINVAKKDLENDFRNFYRKFKNN